MVIFLPAVGVVFCWPSVRFSILVSLELITAALVPQRQETLCLLCSALHVPFILVNMFKIQLLVQVNYRKPLPYRNKPEM